MYNTKFILESGQELYPGYLSTEQRQNIKNKYGNRKGYMRCGCKSTEPLFYRISEDCKIYPEHNNYHHDKSCCRYKNVTGLQERQTAYVINDETGDVTAYLKFDPKTFRVSENQEDEQENIVPPELEGDELELDEIIIGKDDKSKDSKEKKDIQLSLSDLIRSINVDSFSEKILNNRHIESKEQFSKYVYYRMKKIKVSKMRKSLGELTLEKDGVRFFYLPVSEIIDDEINGIHRCYIKTLSSDGREYSNFIYEKTLKTALKEYKKRYIDEPDQNTMVAGFQYLKKGKNKKTYRVFGRVHLFQVSDIGIYCRNLIEKHSYDRLINIAAANSNIRFWIPPDDTSIGGIVQVKNQEKKILLLFRSKKDEPITYDSSQYVPFVINSELDITYENICNLLD